jgi:DNA-binding Xre family transcriptional regulator
MKARERATGQRVTYESLAKATGLSRSTVEAAGSRSNYNPRLSTVARLCEALGCSPNNILEYIPSKPQSGARERKK